MSNNNKNYVSTLIICAAIILGASIIAWAVYNNNSSKSISSPDEETIEEEDSYEEYHEEKIETHKSKDNSSEHELTISKASADFRLGNQAGNSYKASNLIDGNPATAWAVTLSNDLVSIMDIIGPVFHLSKPSKITSVEITNGYCKNSKSYHNNTRAAYVEIARWHTNLDGEYAEGQTEGSDRKDIIYSGPLDDVMRPQRLKVSNSFDNSKPTSDIVIRFKDPSDKSAYYHGDKWNDLCISEFRVFGK